jgi:uncharacterized Zn-finger protein
VHARIHEPSRPFQCTYPCCGKSYKKVTALRDHEAVHTREKKFHCDLCDMLFVRKCTLKSHNILKHQLVQKPDLRKADKEK